MKDLISSIFFPFVSLEWLLSPYSEPTRFHFFHEPKALDHGPVVPLGLNLFHKPKALDHRPVYTYYWHDNKIDEVSRRELVIN